MNAHDFTDSKSGELIPIEILGVKEWAFVPSPLPQVISKETINNLCIEALMVLAELHGVTSTLPSPALLQRPLEDRESLKSSKLEGTIAKPEDLLLFGKSGVKQKITGYEANPELEVHNYREALRYGQQQADLRGVSLSLIREMHQRLLHNVRGESVHPGRLRTTQVAIGTNFRYIPPPPTLIGALMDDLINYIAQERQTVVDRLLSSYIAHYQFESIHPFEDGNGRIGRVILAVSISRAMGHKAAWLYLSPYFEENKFEYIDRMYRVSTHGDWLGWIEFCLKGTVLQGRDAINRCNLLRELQLAYEDKLRGQKSVRLSRVVGHLFLQPIVDAAYIARTENISFKTAQRDLAKLIKLGVLKELISTRFAYAPGIFHIAYSSNPAENEGNDTDGEITI